MSVTAIVVNYNAGDLLGQCVLDLLASEVQPRVRVVDNASTDGSAEKLLNLYGRSPQVRITMNPSNFGFARAVNAALGSLDSDYVLVINPDCRVQKDTVGLLLRSLEEDARAALAGPLVLDGQGRPESASLRRFPDPKKSFMTVTGMRRLERWLPACAGVVVDTAEFRDGPVRAEAVSGACMLIRMAALRQVGRFDESYGLHCEDLDLMYRLHEAGWHCLFVPAARAVHHKGVSSKSRPMWVHRQKHAGMSRFFNKFQASEYSAPLRWLVRTGIWLRYLVLLPWAALRK